MGADATDALLAHAAELARRDELVAGRLEAIVVLADHAGKVRSRAEEVATALGRFPAELDELARRRADAAVRESAARAELETAEARLSSLESGRRRREDELERARSELETARDAHADDAAEVERLDEAASRLRSEHAALETEVGRLVQEATAVAAELRSVDGIADGAMREPGATLADLEEWGAQARSALFVVRGTLEAQRERIVVEANALGSAVLGEELGGSSVALVHRRVAEALGAR